MLLCEFWSTHTHARTLTDRYEGKLPQVFVLSPSPYLSPSSKGSLSHKIMRRPCGMRDVFLHYFFCTCRYAQCVRSSTTQKNTNKFTKKTTMRSTKSVQMRWICQLHFTEKRGLLRAQPTSQRKSEQCTRVTTHIRRGEWSDSQGTSISSCFCIKHSVSPKGETGDHRTPRAQEVLCCIASLFWRDYGPEASFMNQRPCHDH
jgi:hypothetical protein